jgi:hypothetical protein
VRETRHGWEEAQRAERVRALRDIHDLVGHAIEVVSSDVVAAEEARTFLIGGVGARGRWFTLGHDIRGKIAASGVELPLCSKVADALIDGADPRGETSIPNALAEAEAQIKRLAQPA